MRRDPFHRVVETLARWTTLAFWDFRVEGVENVPASGGVMLACTHQSHLDPPMIRAPMTRHAGIVARSTLFRSRVVGAIARYFGAVAFDREGAGSTGMREVLGELEAGRSLILFPEGTRSRDGRIGPLKPGLALLVRRSGAPVVPVAIEGTFQCWPRSRRIFRPGRVRIVYGEPVDYERAGREEILADLKTRLEALRERALSMA